MNDDATPPPISVSPGYLVGPWRVTTPIGAGSWGSVYGAESTVDGTEAAIKFLRTDLLTPGQRTAMDDLVRREARFSLEADHPHIVRTHTVRTLHDPERPDLDGVTALVMDRAECSLQDLLRERPGKAVPVAQRVLQGVIDGLAHVHARGWVHGDLKPANILLAADGAVWLADFGLTAELEGTHAYVLPLGSIDHVPPEWWSQRTGCRGTKLRPTADVWAFGVLAHQVLTGGLHPFPGSTARARALAAQSYAREGAPLRLDAQVPDGWRELIGDCLRPDHASRASVTAESLAARVRSLSRPHRAVRRRTAVVLAACGTLLAALAGTGVVLATDAGQSNDSAGDGPSPSGTSVTAAPLGGALPARSDVPDALRPYITNAAQRCSGEEVTPALIAAMLKAESGFDADAHRVRTGKDGIRIREYGIAMWTPEVFDGWAVDGDGDGRKDYMSPPDAIGAMGAFLCHLDQYFKGHGMRRDVPALLAAAYRTSGKVVVAEGGVPERTRPFVEQVLKNLAEYGSQAS
ncbi:serine/threonine-protein kinase [Streptomyces sp. NBC_01304]|uniref:serine/threonine-protein kinase n=1 Tax=Streptomyces sp. NBC_01304 TaxID=2903818 RepID=UPI002E0D5E4F|nr:serine/threonine-protein kinase [Streptomyces sp. NBC_01304]